MGLCDGIRLKTGIGWSMGGRIGGILGCRRRRDGVEEEEEEEGMVVGVGGVGVGGGDEEVIW